MCYTITSVVRILGNAVITRFYHHSPWHVMAERLRPPESSSGVSDQQSLGSSPGRDTVVPLSKTLKIIIASFFGPVCCVNAQFIVKRRSLPGRCFWQVKCTVAPCQHLQWVTMGLLISTSKPCLTINNDSPLETHVDDAI